MKKYKTIYKKVGQTPLQALEEFRKTDKNFEGVSMTYAGRLDPMAEGELLVLIGDECKKRKKYDGLDKEYEFEMLLGLKTDAGDVLGLVERCEGTKIYSEEEIRAVLSSLVGKQSLPYPAFSSKVVSGKPLFHHAIEDTLDRIEIPKSDVDIYKIKFIDLREISKNELVESINSKISLLRVDCKDSRTGSGFRKEEILDCWKTFSDETTNYQLVKCIIVTSSGTYIRAIIPLIAKRLGTYGLAYSIKRIKIGLYFSIMRNFGFWTRIF